jgi:phosphoesterase RecJ-like protein
MQELLRLQGKHAVAFCVDPIPDKYSFLPGVERFVRYPQQYVGMLECAVILDCGDIARTGLSDDFFDGMQIINIDHHQSNNGELGAAWVDTKYAATGEMIHELSRAAGWPLNTVAATALFTALATDTGFFRFSNTSPAAMRMAADLLEIGVNARQIAEYTMERRSLSEICVLRESLSSLQQHFNGAVASLVIKRAVCDECGIAPEEVEGLVDYPRSIPTTDVAVLYREIEDKVVRVSLRSKGSVDVSRVASYFGGGGHVRAAGCTLNVTVQEAEAAILRRLALDFVEDV